MTVERDILDRIERLGIDHFVTGSWALGVYAEPRMTRDIDIVGAIDRAAYESSIRPEFETDYLVNDPIDLGGRWIGGLIHRREIARADLLFGRDDAWARSAMSRRRRWPDPTLGPIWVIAPEDLVLAKLEWSEGTAELQLRDVRSILRLTDDLDVPYLERYAAILGITERLEAVRAG
jgi:hypothetical protein